jgi:hypothetical protein
VSRLPNHRSDRVRTGVLTLLAELRKLRLDCPPDDFKRRTSLDGRIDELLDRLNTLDR